jgi:LPS-assembly lipoprotein
MSLSDSSPRTRTRRPVARIGGSLFALALAGFVGGCFQPMYAEHPVAVGAAGNPGVVGKLRAVDVAAIDTPAGSRIARVSVNVRNELIYDLTGGGGGFSPTHRLDVKLTATQLQVIVDINTARPDVNNYGIDSTYTLTELATGRVVVRGQTFARVSYNIPGQEQRFAGERGLRDAENRAAKEIAENIRTRLASFFVAGT